MYSPLTLGSHQLERAEEYCESTKRIDRLILVQGKGGAELQPLKKDVLAE
jgi:hypothetical protein